MKKCQNAVMASGQQLLYVQQSNISSNVTFMICCKTNTHNKRYGNIKTIESVLTRVKHDENSVIQLKGLEQTSNA